MRDGRCVIDALMGDPGQAGRRDRRLRDTNDEIRPWKYERDATARWEIRTERCHWLVSNLILLIFQSKPKSRSKSGVDVALRYAVNINISGELFYLSMYLAIRLSGYLVTWIIAIYPDFGAVQIITLSLQFES
ncbi:hypothetical protein BC629DRAFT_1434080 [Irpex lacteus]|nr:hypothetical protein BC629DRAFT_1434080 [Irpex lacteus]